MEEPEEISDPRGDSLVDQISDKIHGGDDSSSSSVSEWVAEETWMPPLQTQTQTQTQPQPQPQPRPDAPPQLQPSYVRKKANRVSAAREEPPQKAFGGVKHKLTAVDIIFWRNKKVSASLLGGATAIWIFFELLEYPLLTLVCHVTILGLGLLFLWSNSTTFINQRPPHIPGFRLPEDPFIVVAVALCNEINRAIAVLREIAAGRDLKKFLVVVGVMWALSILGSFVNFLTLFYIAFVFLFTVPILLEVYNDKINGMRLIRGS